MSTAKDFTELIAWQRADDLERFVQEIIKRPALARDRDYLRAGRQTLLRPLRETSRKDSAVSLQSNSPTSSASPLVPNWRRRTRS